MSNSWKEDGLWCTTDDCVEIWHAVANTGGIDVVNFSTTASGVYTYAFLRDFVGYSGTTDASIQDNGTNGVPSVTSFPPDSDDLVVAVAACTAAIYWSPGQYYYRMGDNTGWWAATQFSPGWTHGDTTAPWVNSCSSTWAEVAVAYEAP